MAIQEMLKAANALADELSDGGQHPVRGYVWSSPINNARGSGVFRTDAQSELNQTGTKTFIHDIPWSKAKLAKLDRLLNSLRKQGCDVIEISRDPNRGGQAS